MFTVQETSAAKITFGVDDPEDATADKVGKYVRGPNQYSDLKFKFDKDVQFDNFNTMSIEIYYPSTNNAAVVGDMGIFIADESFGNFWEDWTIYSSTSALKDEWVLFELPLNNAKTQDEIDWDLIGIKIGKDDSALDATFYVRNFKFYNVAP